MAIVLPMGVLSERLKWTLTKIESGNFSNGGGWISDEQFYFSSTSETPSTLSTTSIPTSNKKMALTGVCKLLHFNYLWEIMLFWEIFLPILGLLCFFSSSCRKVKAEPLSWIWLYSVLHANISVYVWCFYFIFTYNYCWQEIANLKCPDCSTVACTGGIFLGISLVISIIAAIANDQYYPDARMTPREAKNYFQHLQRSHPDMVVILRTHLNSMGDWKRVKKTFYPQHWYDDTVYPDVAQSMTARKSVVFKITMDVYAKTTEAKDDLRSFVWDFGQENNQTITLEDLEEYVIGAALHPAQGQNQLAIGRTSRRGPSIASRYGRYQGTGIPRKQPTLTTDKTLRIYVRQDGELPLMLDCLLRFAWILNLIGLSGIVLHCLTNLQSITEKVHVEKRYGPRRPCDQNPAFRSDAITSEYNAESIPSGSRHPLDSPPPRYVSVVALNEIEKFEKEKLSNSKHRDRDTVGSEGAAGDDSGLPSYEEAVMQLEDGAHGPDGASCNDVTVDGKRRKENVVKISMV